MTFRERYNCDVGLSDHSGTIYPSLAAATLGATYVEVHTVFSKQCFGPDVSSSVTLDELSQIVEGSNFIHQCISCDYSKDLMSEELSGLALLFGKSLYASKDLVEGQVLLREDVSLLKPAGGIPSADLEEYIGKTLKSNCAKGEQLHCEMFN